MARRVRTDAHRQRIRPDLSEERLSSVRSAKLTPEEPGDAPRSDLVERVISDLDRLTRWTLTPPIVPLRWVGEKLRTDT
jgi:hypothetical protein